MVAAAVQPMMMPLLQEMPQGRVGIQVMQQAVHTTLFGEPYLCRKRHAQVPCMHVQTSQPGYNAPNPHEGQHSMTEEQCAASSLFLAAKHVSCLNCFAGVALTVYFGMGFFGAALYGQ